MALTILNQLANHASDIAAFETDKKITWCSNCGNYGIQNALERVLALEGLKPQDFLLCFDVGCNGNGSDKIEAYTVHGLHGRVLPLAAGAALANPKLKVIASAGDGATFSEGANHLVHAVRNNFPFVFIHHNNENYGLTTGQATACTRTGIPMNGTPNGVVTPPINSLQFVLSLQPSFVARSFSGEVDHLTEILREALNHPGFAFVEVLQACPTYNKATPDEWYSERIKDVKHKKGYDPTDIWQARHLVEDIDNDIYIGVLYRDPKRVDFLTAQPNRKKIKTAPVEEVKHVAIGDLY